MSANHEKTRVRHVFNCHEADHDRVVVILPYDAELEHCPVCGGQHPLINRSTPGDPP